MCLSSNLSTKEFQFGSNLTQQEAELAVRHLGVLVRVRHTSSCRVSSKLCGPRATEAPSLNSSGRRGRAVSSASFRLGDLTEPACCPAWLAGGQSTGPGGGPDRLSVWI